ncbi:MAG TPA: DUF3048 domain-containing protein [Acidimicrobiales bacterium]|nr:DUF3048 domain-containing protein [Acidimicrobiales bacterium]
MRKPVIAAAVALIVLVVGALIAWPHLHTTVATTTVPTTTTTVVHYPDAPLTGLSDPTGVSLKRPALTVKVENTPEALPQWGIDQADVVYEEIVNGGITRLAAVFNSHAPARVGPVRSVRPTDQQIVWPLGGIFAFSGGAPYAVQSISQAPVKLVDESSAGAAMFRDPTRYAPHNLYADATKVFALGATLGATPVPPPALFTYRGTGRSATGPVAAKFVVPFPSEYAVTWTWDTTTHGWDRTLFGQPIVTGTNVRVSPKNVIVMYVNYVNGVGTFTSYANLQGTGSALVFTDGHELHATWSHGTSKSSVITYTNAAGQPIALTPGQTWVELLNTGVPLSVTP